MACNLKQESRRKLKCQRHAVTQTEDTDITCPSSLAGVIKLRPWVETNLCVADVKKQPLTQQAVKYLPIL